MTLLVLEIKKTISVFFSYAHEKIFNEKISIEFELFLKRISYVSIGTIVAAIFSSIFNIIAARILDPSGYGTFAIVQSFAMFLYIPMLLGFHTAIVKYCAETNDIDIQRQIISTVYIMVFLLTIISAIFFIMFSTMIGSFFSISENLFYYAILFAIIFVFYTLIKNTLNAIKKFRLYTIFQVVTSFVILLSFLTLITMNNITNKSMIIATLIAYVIVGFIFLIYCIRKFLFFYVDYNLISLLSKFSIVAGVGGLIYSIYSNVDKIILNYYLGVTSVGLYAVYYYSAFTVTIFLTSVFITVFFPIASECKNKIILYRKLNAVIPYLLILGIPFVIFSEIILLFLFGKQYPIDFILIVFFAVAAILVMWYEIYAWLFSSEGIAGAKIILSIQILIAIVNVSLNFILVPINGIQGAVLSIICAFSAGILLIYYHGEIFFRKSQKGAKING